MTGRAFDFRGTVEGLVIGAAAIAIVSGVIAVLDQVVAPLGLTSLYLFAIFPVAIVSGFWVAGIVAVASFLTFEFFFVPPVHSFRIAESDTAAALAIAFVTAYLVSALAGRAQERARQAEEAQREVRRIADEQSALRRVATLVSRAPSPAAVFAAVAEETGRLVPADRAFVARYKADETVTIVAAWSATGESPPASTSIEAHFPSDDQQIVSRLVREAGRAAGIDAYREDLSDQTAALGSRSAVGAPITVEGRLWGLMVVAAGHGEQTPPGTQERLTKFAELVATAIANTEAQAELTASRARIVATADETRRRIERDLHDGAQQRLVSLALQLQAAQAALPPELGEVAAELDRVSAGLTSTLDELREYARGIHPAILAEGGLAPALRSLARRSAVPVDLDVRTAGRLPEPIEVGAYYVVSEALANVAKHADASVADVDVEAVNGVLRILVRDDGLGGADFARGSGLIGLKDRVEALGGRISVESPRGGGTSVEVELPLTAEVAVASG